MQTFFGLYVIWQFIKSFRESLIDTEKKAYFYPFVKRKTTDMKKWQVKDDQHKYIVFCMPLLNIGMNIVGTSVLMCGWHSFVLGRNTDNYSSSLISENFCSLT